MIRPYLCSSEYQDKHHGPGQRSKNKTKQGNCRRTVCAMLEGPATRDGKPRERTGNSS